MAKKEQDTPVNSSVNTPTPPPVSGVAKKLYTVAEYNWAGEAKDAEEAVKLAKKEAEK